MEPEGPLACLQDPAKSKPCVIFRRGVVSPSPNPQAGRPPLVSFPRLLIQYIRSYPPYLESVSSIRNPRTRHAVVAGTHINK